MQFIKHVLPRLINPLKPKTDEFLILKDRKAIFSSFLESFRLKDGFKVKLFNIFIMFIEGFHSKKTPFKNKGKLAYLLREKFF